jgi:predicted Fe-S protein YdhL (DUF1289 family)
VALSIAPHRFTGWEPVEHTRYEYDDDGRLIHSTTTREPEWDDIDQAIIACYVDYKNGLCPDCGRPLDEALKDLNKPDDQQPQYRGFYHWCLACYALERAQHKESERDQAVIDHAPKGEHPFVPSRHRKWDLRRTN